MVAILKENGRAEVITNTKHAATTRSKRLADYTYSVLLLRPEPVARPYGRDTHYLYVQADSADEAVKLAQRHACAHDGCQDLLPENYHVLLITQGHNPNLKGTSL